MSMLTLQVLGLLLLFGLIGALVGWLIRPFFCKSGSAAGRGNLSGSANANAKMGKADASMKTSSVNTSVDTSTLHQEKQKLQVIKIKLIAEMESHLMEKQRPLRRELLLPPQLPLQSLQIKMMMLNSQLSKRTRKN